jgi:hypothetical protein
MRKWSIFRAYPGTPRVHDREPPENLAHALVANDPAVCYGTMLICPRIARADVSEAVSSSVSDSYVRTKLSDGSFKAETYSFGEGGHLAGPTRDDSIDRLAFIDVARVMAGPLASSNYVPAADRNPENTKLLIMVYWGTTNGATTATSSAGIQKLQAAQGAQTTVQQPPEMSFIAHCSCDSSQMNTNIASVVSGMQQNEVTGAFAVASAESKMRDKMREQTDMQYAVFLGYDAELADASRLQQTVFRNRREDLLRELEESRDFVVLKAYDFQALWKHKKRSLLWVTRLSVRERGTNFGGALPTLASNASKYFGQDSRGLVRSALPDGRVEIGDVKTLALGVVPEK